MTRGIKQVFGFMVLALLAVLGAAVAGAQTGGQANTTVIADLNPNSATGIRIEGLVADRQGNLYTSDLDSRNFYRINASSGAVTVLGQLPRTASGMAYDAQGNLYMASGDVIMRLSATALTGNTITNTDVITYATGVTGANGLAFGPGGELYVSGGATGNIYVVPSSGVTRTWASGFTSERQDQRISTNGLAFGPDGRLYSSNTGTGAIDRVTVNADGSAGAVQRFATSPLLLGADGINFAANGDLYVAANERNAIVRVAPDGIVTDVTSNNNSGPLEFPASPAFSGNALYASNFDIARGANAPNDPGVGASIARIDVGVAGAPLPFTGATQGTPVATAPAGSPTVSTGTTTAVAASPTVPAAATTTVAASPTVPSTPVPLPTATTGVQPTEVQPAPAPTTITPGMPSTGAGGDSALLYLMLLAVASILVVGIAARRSARARG
jgi:sugar lactone lactonase YvrE